MTKNEKIQKIKEAVQIAVPDIMKLEMGCKVVYLCEEYKIDRKINIVLQKDGIRIGVLEPSGYFGYEDEQNFKILGRDITLEDVLLAVMEVENPIKITTHGDGRSIFVGDNLEAQWFLNKPLHLQDPSTIDFIYNLIVNNK